MTEIWLPVPGFEGSYEVSDQGQVRSLTRTVSNVLGHERRITGRTLSQITGTRGYLKVTLGKGEPRWIHQLVLATFVGPRPAGMVCRHLNDIQTDNRLSNLAYGTHSQNNFDAIANGRVATLRTHCKNGHEFAGRNLMIRSDGRTRACRACAQAKDRRRQDRAIERARNRRHLAAQQSGIATPK